MTSPTKTQGPAAGTPASDGADRLERLARAQAALRAAHPQSRRTENPQQPDLFDSGIVGVQRAAAAKTAAVVAGVPPAATAMAMRKPAAGPFVPPALPQRGLELQAGSPPKPAEGSPENPAAAQVRGTIVRIRHEQADEDFYIFTVQPLGTKSPRDQVNVKGHGLTLKPGMDVDISGEWFEDPKYGRQMRNALATQIMPVSEQGIRELLSRGFVKGIGPQTAEKLVRRFGNQVFDIAERNPSLLTQVDGMTSQSITALVNTVREKKSVPHIMSFLAEVGLGPALSHRVFRELGSSAVDVIKKNPYQLTSVPMVGFTKADQVALKLGVPFDSEARIIAAMEATLLKVGDQGSTAMEVEQLKGEMGRKGMLTVQDPRGRVACVNPTVIDEVVEKELSEPGKFVVRKLKIRDEDGRSTGETIRAVSLRSVAFDERRIAEHLLRLKSSPVSQRLSRTDFSNARFAHLDEDQLAAARLSLKSSVSVITGRPGCGKTTVTKSIIDTMESVGLKVMLVAPTGKAAKQMTKATGRQATTVHRALKSMGAGKFAHDQENPLQADVIFADEFSMMESSLTERFLRAIKTGTQLVKIGDKDQLRAIGLGNVLADVIASGAIPVSVLSKIHRQAAGSAIIANAHRIINGEVPQPPQPGQNQDFALIECFDKEKQIQGVVELYKDLMKRGFKPEDIQILTPMRKSEDPLGSNNLNMVLKELLNPASSRRPDETIQKKIGKGAEGMLRMSFSVGDRVMQMANNKDLGIFNGDVGYIVEMDHQEKTLLTNFGGELVEMSMTDIEDLDLSYATTYHKSQGSEYRAVIMPLSKSHGHMLDRNMLYTAETRGKEWVGMIGDLFMLPSIVKKESNALCVTGLRDELEFFFPHCALNSDVTSSTRSRSMKLN